MESEIRSVRAELKELKAMHDDAQISKTAAQEELAKHEKIVYSERKQREIELTKMKKEAEEKKIQHERIERRIVIYFVISLELNFNFLQLFISNIQHERLERRITLYFVISLARNVCFNHY